MDSKIFGWIIFISVLILAGIYFVLPKYEYIDDHTPDVVRFNKVTGELEVKKYGKWDKVVDEAEVKVYRPTISYDEFAKSRLDALMMRTKLDEMNRKKGR